MIKIGYFIDDPGTSIDGACAVRTVEPVKSWNLSQNLLNPATFSARATGLAMVNVPGYEKSGQLTEKGSLFVEGEG